MISFATVKIKHERVTVNAHKEQSISLTSHSSPLKNYSLASNSLAFLLNKR